MRILAACVLALTLLLSSPVFALDGRLVSPNGAPTVIIWKDKDAHDKALNLIDAGVAKTNPALLMPLIACIVPTGTRAVITSAGFATHDIMVIEGEHSGCQGNIPMELFKH